MSHELRTPLNAIIGYTGVQLMGLVGPIAEEQRTQLEVIQSSGKHLLSLINDLLDLAKIESGKVEITLEPVVSQDVLEEVVAILRPLAEEKGLALELKTPSEPLIVDADRRILSQIMLNLATNAVKFTDRGARDHRAASRRR